MENLIATISTEPTINTSLSNPTYRGAKGDKGDKGDTGPAGPAGLAGKPGVHIGEEPPEDLEIRFWIDTDENTLDYKYYIDQKVATAVEPLSNIDIEELLGGFNQ